MPLLTRKSVILAEIESVYGSDPTPTGSANAILVRNLSVPNPQGTEFAPRDLVRPYLGNSENLPNDFMARVEFEVELAGAGAAGTAPKWGPVLRACGFAERLFTPAVTGTAQAGAASTITLAVGASAVDDFYNGLLVEITGGTGSGQQRVVSDYNGTTKVATVNRAWDTQPDNTSTYSFDAQAVYTPISAAFESNTIYYNTDGVLHKMFGCRGTVSLGLSIKNIPVLRFAMTGIYEPVIDTALPTVDYSGFQKPLTVNRANSPGFVLHAYDPCLSDLSIDLNNEIVFRSLVNCDKQVLITDRRVSGQAVIEAPTVAEKDYWDITQAATLGGLFMQHGSTDGNIVIVDSANVQLTEPQYQSADGIQMLQMGLVFVPTSAGNDELSIIVK